MRPQELPLPWRVPRPLETRGSQSGALLRARGAYHGLPHLHLDNVLVDVVALVLARDAVVDVLPEVMLAAREGSRSGARKGGSSQVCAGMRPRGPPRGQLGQDWREPLPLGLHLLVRSMGWRTCLPGLLCV